MKVGIVGMGFMGNVHLAAWRATPATVIGVYSPQYRDETEGITRYDSYEALLQDVDVIDICSPTYLHYEMVLQAAQSGTDIVCEKPLSLTVEQGHKMIAACDAVGVRLLVAHVVRFFPEYVTAKQAVEREDIGQVAVVRLTRASFKPGNSGSWLHDIEKSGGMLLDLMIHDFDYARWVAGEVESVFCKSAAQSFQGIDGDYSLVILRHHNGAISNIEGGWIYPKPLFRTSIEIAGSKGLIEHPSGSSTPLNVYLKQPASHENPDISVPSSPLAEDPYTTEMKHFYHVLTDHVEPRVHATDALAAVKIAMAARQSAQTGKPVRIEEVM